MDSKDFYYKLDKPSWSPPSSVFGPVWTALYTIIFFSYGYVGYLYFTGQISFMVVLPFILNLITNIAYSPIQFRLRNLPLASIDIILVLATLIWAIVAIYPHAIWISLVNIPYLLWVCFATVLQLTITKRNI